MLHIATQICIQRRICSHCCVTNGNVTKLVPEWTGCTNNHQCKNSVKLTIYGDKKSSLCFSNEINPKYCGIFHPKYHMKCSCNSDPSDGCCITFPTVM